MKSIFEFDLFEIKQKRFDSFFFELSLSVKTASEKAILTYLLNHTHFSHTTLTKKKFQIKWKVLKVLPNAFSRSV